MRLKINRAILGYIMAGIVMLCVFLYLRFPGEAVTDYVKAAAAARYPQLLLSIDATKPTFPPGMAFANVTASPGGRPEATLHVDSLRIRPGGLSLLGGRLSLLMAAEGYGGEAEGEYRFLPTLFSPGACSLRGQPSGIFGSRSAPGSGRRWLTRLREL